MRTPKAWRVRARRRGPPAFAAIDLGTNNCRLLVASPRPNGLRVVDAFSRIVRLGEGLAASGALSEAAMERALDALRVCASKMAARRVAGSRCIATQACRAASNGEEFLRRIERETGLKVDVVTPEEEAVLAVKGCHDLIDHQGADAVAVFDIGGGSTELSWLLLESPDDDGVRAVRTVGWTSMPLGVVSLAERFAGKEIERDAYDAMAAEVTAQLEGVCEDPAVAAAFAADRAHLIGTSGTVTSIAGVHLGLKRYARRDVDGVWLDAADAEAVSERLRAMRFEDRAAEPCIGKDRADLVVPGCAILSGILAAWPTKRIRVGDRGLREGILIDLIAEWRANRR